MSVGTVTTYGVFNPVSDRGMADYKSLILSANHQVRERLHFSREPHLLQVPLQ